MDDKFSAVVKTIDDLMLSLQKQFEANMQYEVREIHPMATNISNSRDSVSSNSPPYIDVQKAEEKHQ